MHLALSYLDIFFSGQNLDRLYDLFDPSLHFEGPFFTFDTAETYIEALKQNPPAQMAGEILHTFESGETACVIYTLKKPGVETPVAQLFETNGDRITKILLIFDTRMF